MHVRKVTEDLRTLPPLVLLGFVGARTWCCIFMLMQASHTAWSIRLHVERSCYLQSSDRPTDRWMCISLFITKCTRECHRGPQNFIPARTDMSGGCSGIILMYTQAGPWRRTSQAGQMSLWLDKVPRMHRWSAPNQSLQPGAIVQLMWLLFVQCSSSSESLCGSLHHAGRLPGAYAQRGTLNPVIRLQMVVMKRMGGVSCVWQEMFGVAPAFVPESHFD